MMKLCSQHISVPLKEQKPLIEASSLFPNMYSNKVFVFVCREEERKLTIRKKDDDGMKKYCLQRENSYCFLYHLIDILYRTWRDHKINLVVSIYRKTAIREILRITANTSDDLGNLLCIYCACKSLHATYLMN